MSEPKILIAFDRANNILIEPVFTDAGHAIDRWWVVDANTADPDVNWPGECISGTDGHPWEEAKRIQREAQAKILAEGFALTEEQYLLICLIEECAEVSQRVCKGLRFGMAEVQAGQDQNNAERIAHEMSDLHTVRSKLEFRRALPLSEYSPEKSAKLDKYMVFARDVCGTLA